MKRPLIVIAMLTLALAGGQAQARPACMPYEIAVRQLAAKHQETKVQAGMARDGWRVELWLSEGGKTWTLLNVSARGIACVGAAGRNWRAAAPAPADGEDI